MSARATARTLGIPEALVRLREAAIGCYAAEHPADLEVGLVALPDGRWRAALEIQGSLAEDVEGEDPHEVLDQLAQHFGGYGAPISRAATLLRFPHAPPSPAPVIAPAAHWAVGDRVRELGPIVFVVPRPHERPARTGTVVWSGAAMTVVHWDGAPAPDPARPAGDACVPTAWLEPASDAPASTSTAERTAP